MNQDTNPITVIIADDHQLIREGFDAMLKKVPGVKVLAFVKNGHELVSAVRNYLPQVVLTDIRMALLDGVEATRSIKARYPHIKVLALSAYDEHCLVKDMMAAGASGYLLKDVDEVVLAAAIKTAASGGTYYCADIAKKMQRMQQPPPLPKNIAFTEREIEIMLQVCTGRSNREISKLLSISMRTVETHRHALYRKIGVNSAVGVALYAQRHGYLKWQPND